MYLLLCKCIKDEMCNLEIENNKYQSLNSIYKKKEKQCSIENKGKMSLKENGQKISTNKNKNRADGRYFIMS